MSPKHPLVHIIWVTPRFPWGPPDGARHATATLLRQLVKQGATVDVISLIADKESVDISGAIGEFGLRSLFIIRRSVSFWGRLPTIGTPFTFRAFRSPSVRSTLSEKLQSLLQNETKSTIIVDGLHPFAALPDGWLAHHQNEKVTVVYRAHNYETALWEQCVEMAKTPWYRLFFKHQTHLVGAFEGRVSRQVSGLAPVSAEDGERFRRVAPTTPMVVMPIGMDFSESEPPPQEANDAFAVLFVGRLDWLPNKNGLTWFLSNVWPRVIEKRPNAMLKIAGVGNGGYLETFRSLRGVHLLGRVESLDPLYQECTVAIAPLFQGSGTRVKILEAGRFSRPVLTTALGAEGCGLVPDISYFRAEDAEAWISSLVGLSPEASATVGRAAYDSIRSRFDSATIAARLIDFLMHLAPPH